MLAVCPRALLLCLTHVNDQAAGSSSHQTRHICGRPLEQHTARNKPIICVIIIIISIVTTNSANRNIINQQKTSGIGDC
jgi:hypothetical protein